MRHPALFAAVAAAALAACGGLRDAMTAHVDVVAKAGSQELSVERLANLIGNSKAPLRKDIARTVADVWVDYQLLSQSAAKEDSLNDPKLIDEAMWSAISAGKIRKYYDIVSKSWTAGDSTKDQELYESGDVLAAKHILIAARPNMSPVDIEKARQKAEELHKQATPANFAELARKNSSDSLSAQRGGDLGFFPSGQMVAEFEKAVKAVKPGQISPVIRSQFGFHIIYRPTYAEIKPQFTPVARQRGLQRAESTYMARAEEGAKVDVKKNASATVRAVAANTEEHRADKTVVATTKYGDFTAADLARWITAVPQSQQLRAQISQAPDTLMPNFIRNVLRNDIIAHQADSAKIGLDTAELNQLRRAFAVTVTSAWAGLGIAPKMLADSAKSEGDRLKLASARVETYMDKLMAQQAQFIEVPPPLEIALRSHFEWKVNDAGVERAVEKAIRVRAANDSLRNANQPPSSVPLPGQAAPAAPGTDSGAKKGAAAAPAKAPAKKP